MRELVWAEVSPSSSISTARLTFQVKRLLQKKRSGRLIVDTSSTDHVYDF